MLYGGEVDKLDRLFGDGHRLRLGFGRSSTLEYVIRIGLDPGQLRRPAGLGGGILGRRCDLRRRDTLLRAFQDGLLAFTGIGLMGLVSAQLTVHWIHRGQGDPVHRELRALRTEIAELKALLAQREGRTISVQPESRGADHDRPSLDGGSRPAGDG